MGRFSTAEGEVLSTHENPSAEREESAIGLLPIPVREDVGDCSGIRHRTVGGEAGENIPVAKKSVAGCLKFGELRSTTSRRDGPRRQPPYKEKETQP